MTKERKSERPCQLYRHFDVAGQLLYVGISASAAARLAQHSDKLWYLKIARIEVETLSSRTAAQAAERSAIRNERPRYNVALVAPPALEASEADLRIQWTEAAKRLVECAEGRPFEDCA